MPRLDRHDALWLSLLVALVVLFFHQFVFSGRIPLNADWLHSNFEPGRSYLPGIQPHNRELDDPVYQFHPLRVEALRQWRSGHVPLWNPGIMCGAPLLADGVSKPFDPLIVMQLMAGDEVGHGLEILLQFILMAAGAYLVARALGLAHAGAAAAAVVYTFNLLAVTWMELRTATGAFAFFPWAFLFLLAALDGRRAFYAALSGLFGGFMLLAGHPQFALYGLGVLGAFAGWRAAVDLRSSGLRRAASTLALGAAALLLALGLAAVELLPFLELVANSARSPRQYERANSWAAPVSFLTYFYPNLFGNPVRGVYLGSPVLLRPYMTAAAGFTGASTVALALVGVFAARFRAKRFFVTLWLAVPLFTLLVGAGLGDMISAFTAALSGMDLARLVFVSNLAAAFLAGSGVAALHDASWSEPRFRRAVAVVGAAFVAIVVVTSLLGVLARPLVFGSEARAAMLGYVVGLIEFARANLLLWPAVYVSLAFYAAAGAFILLAADFRRAAAPVAAALVAAELMLAGITYNPFVPRALVAPDFPPLAAVRTEPPHEARVLGVDTPPRPELDSLERAQLLRFKGDFLIPNSALLYGLHDIRGDQSLRPNRYLAYVRRIVDDRVNLLADIHLPVHDSRFIDLINARFIMSALPLDGAHLDKVFDDGRSFVYRNRRAFPRAWLTSSWITAPTPSAALALMHERADLDFRRTAVIEPVNGFAPPSPATSSPEGSAEIVEYGPSSITVHATAPGPSILVVSDGVYSGWYGSVDGVPDRVYPTFAALKGIRLDPGRHLVKFTYKPLSFTLGAAISALSLALILTAFLYRRRAKN